MTLKEAIEQHLQNDDTPLADYKGGDWWQLWPEEEFIFVIEKARWPRMSFAYMCYECLLGIDEIDEEDGPVQLLEAERAARPDIVGQGHCIAGFQQFAKEYASLSCREAAAVYYKMSFWGVRVGLTQYMDEDEGAASGPLLT